MVKYKSETDKGKCVFCEIVNGNIKTPGVYWEDERFMAFLSIDPNTEGFSCVIPKKHFGSDILKMPDDDLKDLVVASKNVAGMLEDCFDDVGRVGLIMEGTGVDHAHVKLFPMHGTKELKEGKWKQYLSGKEFWFDKYEGWISSGSGPMANIEKLRELAEKLRKIS
tara:strand:- start:1057 stop:1554 length:498 start_codon:yes stop_codon:yes gene_type:complete